MKKLKRNLTPVRLLVALLLLATAAAFGLDLSPWYPDLRAARAAAISAACQNNQKQIGLIFKMYANESLGEKFPQLDSEPGNLMFQWHNVYPEYMGERDILICPGPAVEAPANPFTDQFYIYTGYVLRTDEDATAFADAYSAHLSGGGDFANDLNFASSYGSKILRLREGIERFFVTDINNPGGSARAQSEIPVFWEWPDNHMEGFGGNVLYMDGHCEWVAYPGKFPMTESAIATFAALANYTPPDAWNNSGATYPYSIQNSFGPSCANNLRQLGQDYNHYPNPLFLEVLPPLSSQGGTLMYDTPPPHNGSYSDPLRLLCPARPTPDPLPGFDDLHYAYLGYVMMADSDVQQFATAYAQTIANGGEFTADINTPTSYGDTMYRLREEVSRDLAVPITDPTQDQVTDRDIPVVVEWPENHEGISGGHVLYLDGHVEWIPYPGKFPMTETAITTLRALAQNTPATEWTQPDKTPDPYGFKNSCSNHLKQWGVIHNMYRNESHGEFLPPLSLTPGELVQREAEVYGDYLSDIELSTCPGVASDAPAEHLDDRHYAYLGYMLLNEQDVQGFAAAYSAEAANGGNFEGDLNTPSSYGNTIRRLREDVNIGPVVDINVQPPLLAYEREIPVMIEWPGNHEGLAGGHVLYLDGHVEWHEYPGKFPMTENVINTLDSLANWTPATEWAYPTWPYPSSKYQYDWCSTNMRFFGLGFKIYANRAKGEFFPPLSSEANTLMMDDERFVRFQLFDMRRTNCPGSPMAYRQPTMDDHSYAYLGYVVRDQADLDRFATAYQQQIANGGDFTENLTVGEETVYRIREGIERFFITDINSPAASSYAQHKIPVMIEWPDNHGPIRGGSVLYMDGHTEWHDYPGEFPMTEEAMSVLTNLAGRGPIRPAPANTGKRLSLLP